MKQFVLLSILLLSFVVCASLGLGQMQPPAPSQGPIGFPDFSGFGLIDSFANLPTERSKLDSLCEIRRASLDEASRVIEKKAANYTRLLGGPMKARAVSEERYASYVPGVAWRFWALGRSPACRGT